MEKVGKAILSYSSNTLLDVLFFFELTLFSFLTGNNDMHLKNFSMIESSSAWLLSPAYDLLNASILNPDDDEELALTLAGKKKNLKQQDFLQLGKGLGLTDKQMKSAFKRLEQNTPKAMEWMKHSFLSKDMIKAYKEVFEKRYKKLGLNR